MVGLPDGEKNFEDMYNCLDSIPACDRRRHSPHYAYASRGKNHAILMKFCTQQPILNWMNVT